MVYPNVSTYLEKDFTQFITTISPQLNLTQSQKPEKISAMDLAPKPTEPGVFSMDNSLSPWVSVGMIIIASAAAAVIILLSAHYCYNYLRNYHSEKSKLNASEKESEEIELKQDQDNGLDENNRSKESESLSRKSNHCFNYFCISLETDSSSESNNNYNNRRR